MIQLFLALGAWVTIVYLVAKGLQGAKTKEPPRIDAEVWRGEECK
jgi:hypothetical protein